MRESFPSISMMIPALKEGDKDSWNDLCEKFRPGMMSKSRFLIRSNRLLKKFSANDLVQEAYLKAWRNHDSFRGESTSQFAKWLLTILRNTFHDWCRQLSPDSSIPTWFDFAAEGETPSAVMISMEREAEMHSCLAEMEPRCQAILFMRHFEGLKFIEIAEQLEMNINTVAGIYRRGLVKLTAMVDRRIGSSPGIASRTGSRSVDETN